MSAWIRGSEIAASLDLLDFEFAREFVSKGLQPHDGQGQPYRPADMAQQFIAGLEHELAQHDDLAWNLFALDREEMIANPTGLLLILLMHRSWRGKKDKHKTWYRWHQERKLIAASISKTKLAELMGVSLSSIYRYTSRLVENGDIRVEIENGENVYVLGYIDNEGKEVFYYTQAAKQRGCQICEKDVSYADT